jgi:hypothetical protein
MQEQKKANGRNKCRITIRKMEKNRNEMKLCTKKSRTWEKQKFKTVFLINIKIVNIA